MHEIAVERHLLHEPMGLVEERHARGLVDAPALHADEPVLDDVGAADAVAAADVVEHEHHLVRRQGLAVDPHRHAVLEVNRHGFRLVGRHLRRHGHAEVDEIEAVGAEVFEIPRLVTGVQAVLVGAVGLALRGLDRDVFLLAELDQFLAAGKPRAEFRDPPGGEHGDRGVERLGGELEAALVVALAGGPMGVDRGPFTMGDLHADLADQRPGDRRAEQIRALITGLPLHRRKREVAAELLADVHDHGLRGAAVAGLLQRRLAVLAGLPEIDVDGDHVVALLDEPAEDHRGVESARIGQHAFLLHLFPSTPREPKPYCARPFRNRNPPPAKSGRHARAAPRGAPRR